MLRFASRSLFGLIALLTACGPLGPLPVSTPLSPGYSSQAVFNSRFEVQWSPDGSKIAVRAAVEPYAESSDPYGNNEPSHPGSDTLNVFDTASGKLLQHWTIPTEFTATSQSLPDGDMQWSPDGQELRLLQSLSRKQLLQSLSLHRFRLGQSRIASREILLPAELKSLDTVGLSLPSLSPDGTHLALYRQSERAGKRQDNLVQLDLSSARIAAQTPLDSSPVQAPVWGREPDGLFVLTQPAASTYRLLQIQQGQVHQLDQHAGTAALLALSPNQNQLLVSYTGSPAAADQLTPGLSAGNSATINLVKNLNTGAETRFTSGPLGTQLNQNAQGLWDHLDRLHQANGEAGAQSVLDIAHERILSGPDPLQMQQIFEQGLILAPDRDPNATLPSLLAYSPADERVLITLPYSSRIYHAGGRFLYIWNGDKQQFQALEADFLDLTAACYGCD